MVNRWERQTLHLLVVVVDGKSSPQTITDNVTSSGKASPVVLIMLMVISRTFSVGNLSLGRAVGDTPLSVVVSPEAVTKITSISRTFFEGSRMFCTVAPRFGRSISIDEELLLKLKPLFIKSSLFERSIGRV